MREALRGSKRFRHPQVGELTLDWDTYPLPGDPGPVMLVFTVEPGSPDAERIALLASLHATAHAERSGSGMLVGGEG